jgi:hypothetical protein
MKPLFLFTAILFLGNILTAQTIQPGITVKGVVMDSLTNKPLGFVTVAIQDAKTGQTIRSSLAKEDGSFVISATAGKTYQLALAFVGYTGKTISLAGRGSPADIGQVVMVPSEKKLEAVSVVAVKPLISRSADGINYNVQSDPEVNALTALDIMRKVPLLTVDASDNIKLKGSGNYKILINGKESALMAKNPSDVLRAMPATNIERIEVITTPPAKYDAEGLSGIINIITKKNTDQGYTLGINGRYNSVWGPGLNMNGTLKKGKFGLSAFAGLNRQRTQTFEFGNNQTFFADNSVLSQNGTNVYEGHNYYGNATVSYEIDSLDLITGNFESFFGKNGQHSQQQSNSRDSSGLINQQYLLTNYGNGSYLGLDASVNYQRGFKSDKNRLLTLSYKYSYSPNRQFNNNSFSDTLNYSVPDYQQYNDAGSREHTIQLDYTHPVKKLAVEAGSKAIFRNNYSDFQSDNYDPMEGKYIINPGQTNNFTYHQNIYSLYNSYQLKLDQWNLKAGLRLEHTKVDGDFVSSGQTVRQDYNNFIPSVSIQRTLKSGSLSFGYTDRIQRPGIYQLNPFVDLSNPKFITTGNPNLNPELMHSFELNYNHFSKNSVSVGLSYAFSNNAIQSVSNLVIDTVSVQKDTVTVTTFRNLGYNRTLGLNFNTSFTFTSAFTLSLNGQLSHIWLSGTYDENFYKNDGYTGNVFANAAYKFKKGYRAAIDAGYFSGDVTLQGKTNAFIYSSYVVSKTFLNKKATVSLVANNPYSRLFTGRSYSKTVDFYQTNYNQWPYRTFAIRFNYKFGKLTSDIKRNERGINNDDTKSGGKSNTGNQ